MKSVVVGGSGFIGRYVVDLLAREGCEVYVYDITTPEYFLPDNVTYVHGDICYLQNLLKVFDGADEVYDTSGILGSSELNFDISRAIDINVKGAYHILEAARLCRVKYTFTSSKPNQWRNVYSITKFAKEELAHMYGELYKMNVAVLCWYNATGPGQHLFPVRKAVPIFIASALLNEDLQIFGDGEQTVDIIYAADIARVTVEITRKWGHLHKTLDFGSGIAITVNDLAGRIIELSGSKSKIVHVPMRIGEPLRSRIVADLEELRAYVEIGELTPLDKTLESTIEYYRKLPKHVLEFALAYFRKLGEKELQSPI